MKRSRFTEEQIIGALKQLKQAPKAQEVVRKLGITEQTYYRWKAKYGGMEASDAKKLRGLEDENRRLKQMVAGQALDIQARKAVVAKKMVRPTGYRQAAGMIRREFELGERRACALLGFPRSSCRYASRRKEPDRLAEELRAHAATRPRFGYRRLHVLLRSEGWRVNHKQVYRLFRRFFRRTASPSAR
jgi:putative transposase